MQVLDGFDVIVPSPRSSLAISFAVWKALFLREAVSRLSGGRLAWLWLIVDPIVHVLVLMLMFGFFFHRLIPGVDAAVFIMTGRLGFSMAINAASRSMDAVDANAALFAYRQVKPIDTVFVRAALEGFLMLVCSLILLVAAGFFGFEVMPDDPMVVLVAFSLLWLFGLGMGLVFSVASELVPEIGKLVHMAFIPLYFLSCVIHPATSIPSEYREWFMLNPIAHGVEALHGGFFSRFNVAPEVNMSYLAMAALVSICLGMALHVRFALRLSAR